MTIRIALDAMGGDHAPLSEVLGAVEAHRRFGVETVLVGDEARLRAQLEKSGAAGLLTIVHAEEVVTMDDPPMTPIRKKRRSSLRLAADLVRAGEAQALVTADPGLSQPEHARLRRQVLTRYGQVLELADVG